MTWLSISACRRSCAPCSSRWCCRRSTPALDHVGRAEQAFFLELQHLHHEARAFMADAVALRHAHVVEEHLGGLELRMPSLSRCGLRLMPGVFIGTMISDLLMCGLSSEVLASRQMKVGAGRVGDPHLAAVDHVVVAVLARGGLQPGHVGAGADFETPMQPTCSPLMAGRRNSSRSSSEPKRARAGVHMSVCTPMDMGMPPQ
jgi:hypothetical protein